MRTRFSDEQIKEFVVWIESFTPEFFHSMQQWPQQLFIARVVRVLSIIDSRVSSLLFQGMLTIIPPLIVAYIASKSTEEKINFLARMNILEISRTGELTALIAPEDILDFTQWLIRGKSFVPFHSQSALNQFIEKLSTPFVDINEVENESDHSQGSFNHLLPEPAIDFKDVENKSHPHQASTNQVVIEKPPVPNMELREGESAVTDLFNYTLTPEDTNISSQETPRKQSPQSKAFKNISWISQFGKTLKGLNEDKDEDVFKDLNPIVDAFESPIVSPQKLVPVARRSQRKINLAATSLKKITNPGKQNVLSRQAREKNKVCPVETMGSADKSPNKRKSIPRRSLRNIKDPIMRAETVNSPDKRKSVPLSSSANTKNPLIEKILRPTKNSTTAARGETRRSLSNTIARPNLKKKKIVKRLSVSKTKSTVESIKNASTAKRRNLFSESSRNTKPRLEEQSATLPAISTNQSTFFPLRAAEINPLSFILDQAAPPFNPPITSINDTPDFNALMVPLAAGSVLMPRLIDPNAPRQLGSADTERDLGKLSYFPQAPSVVSPESNESKTESDRLLRSVDTKVTNGNLYAHFSLKKDTTKPKVKLGKKGEYKSGPNFKWK